MAVIYVNTSDEVKAMLARLAQEDRRSGQAEVSWLIEQEWARRYSQSNPGVTVGDAQAAAQAVCPTQLADDEEIPLEGALETIKRIAKQYEGE